MKSHDVIFDARSIWTQKPRDNAQNLEAQPRGFEHCREVFEQNTPRLCRGVFCWNWTRGERYRLSSGAIPRGNDQKPRGAAERFLMIAERFAPERERYCSPRVQFQPYTSSIKNYIVRFHVYTSTVDYLKYYQDILRYLKYLTGKQMLWMSLNTVDCTPRPFNFLSHK